MSKKMMIAGELGELSPVMEGVSLTRTTIPVLPANHLSRKKLISEFKLPIPGTTLVSAPAGYGKTSLVTEVVLNQSEKVIWYNISENRDRKDFNRHLIQAIRNVIPGFAPWFLPESNEYAYELATKVCNELGQINENFIFVIDNSRVYDEKDDRFSNHLFDILPNNVHVIGIRRATPAHSYSRFASDASFAIYGPSDLRFSDEEIKSYLQIHGVDAGDEELLKVVTHANGWPAAVEMIVHNISRGKDMSDFAQILSSDSEPLRWLVDQVLTSLTENEKETLIALSAVKYFDAETAEVILGKNFKRNELNAYALDGLFFQQSNSPERTYTFNVIMGEALYNELLKDIEKFQAINSRLSAYFEKTSQHMRAVEHARAANEMDRVQELFKQAARILASKGQGQELIRWARYVGDDSNMGLRLRQTVEVMGLIVDFRYNEAMSMIEEMRFGAKGLPIEDFIIKYSHAAEAFIAFAYWRESDFERIFEATSQPALSFDLGDNDKISLKRIEASIAFVTDNYEDIVRIYQEALAVGDADVSTFTHLHLDSIKAMKLYGQGEYQDAFEVASSVITASQRESLVGITGPVDAMFVQALCLLEFADIEEGMQALRRTQNIAERWSLGPWHFLSMSRLARTLAAHGEITEALEMLRASREHAASFRYSHGFDVFNDVSELSIRAKVGDWERVKVLLERTPKNLLNQQVRNLYNEKNGRTKPLAEVDAMPEKTARQKITKYIAQAKYSIDQENIALGHIRRALEIGVKVQSYETFLREETAVLNLVLKVASEKPTVYLETLASLITERMKSSNTTTRGLAAPFTKREIEVLRHLSTGKPISAIAGTLHVSQNTMKTHLKNIYRKIDADGRESAVVKAKALFIL